MFLHQHLNPHIPVYQQAASSTIASKSSRGIMSVAGNTTSVILNETCFERYSIFFGIPYLLFPDRLTNPITGIRDDNIQLEGRKGGVREG